MFILSEFFETLFHANHLASAYQQKTINFAQFFELHGLRVLPRKEQQVISAPCIEMYAF